MNFKEFLVNKSFRWHPTMGRKAVELKDLSDFANARFHELASMEPDLQDGGQALHFEKKFWKQMADDIKSMEVEK